MNNNPEEPACTPEYLDYHYRELVRLSDIHNNHINNSFADVKLLSAVGMMIGWKPLANTLASDNQGAVLLIGFVTILFIVLLLFLLNFMRQSIMLYYTQQIKHHEIVVRKALKLGDEKSFAVAHNWQDWSRKIHEPIAWRFFIYLYLLLISFPTSVLVASEQIPIALTYLGIAIILIGVHSYVTAVIIRQVNLNTH